MQKFMIEFAYVDFFFFFNHHAKELPGLNTSNLLLTQSTAGNDLAGL